MLSQIIYVEDEKDIARTTIKHLGIKEMIPIVRYTKNLYGVKKILTSNSVYNIYIVDINLGRNKEDEGIKIIQFVRQRDPYSLIIVYTSYQDEKEKSLNAGASLFFLKGKGKTKDYSSSILQIRNTIISMANIAKNGENNWKEKIPIYAQIMDINESEGFIRLNCKLQKNAKHNCTFEKKMKLSLFKNPDKLYVDKSILICILERPGELRVMINDGEENYFIEDEEEVDISELEDSDFFKF